MKIQLNGQILNGKKVKIQKDDNKMHVSFSFNVTSETYHDITTLLYENDFQVVIPEKDLSFRANILEYATSMTNLYEKGNTSEFYLHLGQC